jgi:alpha-1,2-mannosyltransferase
MAIAVVVHHNLNSPGGEAAVAIETIQSLNELGYDVHLITIQKPNLDAISKSYGKAISVKKIHSLFPFKINYLGIYQKILTPLYSINSKDVDIVISTNGVTLPNNIPSNIPVVLYLHFPPNLINTQNYRNLKYDKNLFWNAYFKPYKYISKILMKKAFARSNMIMVNSHFTKDAVKKVFPTSNPLVLYPPVNIDLFRTSYNSKFRYRKVLVISRFSPEKQIENAIKIAKLLLKEDINFKIIGSLIPSNKSYFNSLKKMVVDMGVEKNITMVPNATFDEILKSLSESMVYLHTMYGEHFGISIIQAMAAGLVPIVPSFGGCSEIVPLNYQYKEIEEAANYILKAIHEYNSEKREYMHNIAKTFSSCEFRKKIQEYIKQITK